MRTPALPRHAPPDAEVTGLPLADHGSDRMGRVSQGTPYQVESNESA